MNRVLIIILTAFLLVACKNVPQGNKLVKQRAETDTILSFQGIRIMETLDSALYAQLKNDLPIILYDKNKVSFSFTEFVINGEYDPVFPGNVIHSYEYNTLGDFCDSIVIAPSHSGKIVNSLSIQGTIHNYLKIIDLIGLYQDTYGSFSYYLRLKQNNERMGSFPIGKVSEMKGRPYERIDAFSDFIEYAKYSQYKYLFVWEWNNQSIVISHNPNEKTLNTTVSYLNTGHADRQAKEEAEQKQKEVEKKRIEDARSKQQI